VATDAAQGAVAAVIVIVVVATPLPPGPATMILPSPSFLPPPSLLLEPQEPVPFETTQMVLVHRVLVNVSEIGRRDSITSGRRPRGVPSLEIEYIVSSATAGPTIIFIATIAIIVLVGITVLVGIAAHVDITVLVDITALVGIANGGIVLEALLHECYRHMPVLGNAQASKGCMTLQLLLERSGNMVAFRDALEFDKEGASIVLRRSSTPHSMCKHPTTTTK
jgi:hypothetical protein